MGELASQSPSGAEGLSVGLSAPDGLEKDSRWPPRGWPMFACINRQSGTASCTSRESPEGTFLKYDLALLDNGVYALEIMSGHMGRQGSGLAPAIGIRFSARTDWLDEAPQNAVLDIHVRGQSLIPERGLVLRVILAMTYIVSRIDRGAAPNMNRVLKIYRLA